MFRATTRAPATGVPLESVTYPRMLPVLVCAQAAGAATRTKIRPTKSRRPSCANDLRLMNVSPVHVFASLITRPQGFVKSGDGRVNCAPLINLPPFLKRNPDAPAQRFCHGVPGRSGPRARPTSVRPARRRAEDRLPPRQHDPRGETRPAQPALGGQSAER